MKTILGFEAACACASQTIERSAVMIIFIFESRQSANEIFNHFAAELAELFVAAGVEVGELVVIQAE